MDDKVLSVHPERNIVQLLYCNMIDLKVTRTIS